MVVKVAQGRIFMHQVCVDDVKEVCEGTHNDDDHEHEWHTICNCLNDQLNIIGK